MNTNNSNNKPQCILHIGIPKTGSSSIQQTLCALEIDKKVHYLELGHLGNHSVVIYSLFSKNPASHHAHIKANRSRDEIDRFNKNTLEQLKIALMGCCSEKVIISGEDILFLGVDELFELKKFLSEYVSSIQVIAYVRPPISFMQSAFQQNLKEGVTRHGIAGFLPQYRNWLEKFDSVFGKDNVLLIKFDPKSLLDGDVISDFCGRLGILVDPHSYVHTNESISLEAVALLFVYHKFCSEGEKLPPNSKKNQELINALSEIGTRKLKYSSELSKSILKSISTDIEWMESRLGASLTEPLPNPNEGISSEQNLIAIALECANDLSNLISEKIPQQLVTPQKLADWICLLSNQFSIKPIVFSKAQIARLEATEIQPADMLKELILFLGQAEHHKAVANIQSRLTALCKDDFDALNINLNSAAELAYSVDSYQDQYLTGWIVNKNCPLQKLSIEISQDKQTIASGSANLFRQDLANANVGDGCCAFRLKADINPAIDGGPLILRIMDLNNELLIQPTSIKGIA